MNALKGERKGGSGLMRTCLSKSSSHLLFKQFCIAERDDKESCTTSGRWWSEQP